METVELKKGIKLHIIKNNKFKTNVIAVFLTTKLDKKNVTKNALIPAVIRLGNNKIKTQKELNEKLEHMYGAGFNCGVEKKGNNQVLKFYIESIRDEYTLNKEKILEESIEFIKNIVFNPLVENNHFNHNYVNGEKNNLKRIIESKIDNKANYAYLRCIEEMYKDTEFSLFEYGMIEDLENIDEYNLFEQYNKLISECKIDIYVSGNVDRNKVEEYWNEGNIIEKLEDREANFMYNSKQDVGNITEKQVSESMEVAQGKIVIGISIQDKNVNEDIVNVYNAILGGGANSKLFQNVREKASLAYTTSSRYLKSKNNIFIRCGIEIKNYDNAIQIIKEQLKDIENGNFKDKDINSAKELIVASLNSIEDEQTSEISYCISKELENKKIDIEQTIKNIYNVKKEEIIDVAKLMKINTIYFLKD